MATGGASVSMRSWQRTYMSP